MRRQYLFIFLFFLNKRHSGEIRAFWVECVCRVEKEKRMKHYVRFLFFFSKTIDRFLSLTFHWKISSNPNALKQPTTQQNDETHEDFSFFQKKKKCKRRFKLCAVILPYYYCYYYYFIHSYKSVLTLVLLLTTSFSVDFDSEIVSGTLPLMTTFFWSIFVSPTSYFVFFLSSLSLSLSLDW